MKTYIRAICVNGLNPMSLHPDFPAPPYAPLIPAQRCFPVEETQPRATNYERLLPSLVAKIPQEVFDLARESLCRCNAHIARASQLVV